MKNKIKFLVMALLMISVSLLSSCKKDVDDPANPNQENNIENVLINPDFNWETTTTYSITLTGYANSLAEITNVEGKVIARAMLINASPVKVIISVPSNSSKIRLLYQGQDVEISLDDEVINYTFN